MLDYKLHYLRVLPMLAGESSSPVKPDKSPPSFQTLRELGSGAYGLVTLVRKDNRLCALKTISKKKLSKLGKEYEAFVERQLLKNLKHPGIVKLLRCYQDSKNVNYILEYFHGGNLLKFIRRNHQYLNADVLGFYVGQLVSILEYLHSNGVIHRDLKPENIMMTREGHLKLIDFATAEITHCTLLDQKVKSRIIEEKNKAIARQLKQDEQTEIDLASLQQSLDSPFKIISTFEGTSNYLAPELLRENVSHPATDLWALGCILYEIYYLQSPFKGATEFQVFDKIERGQYELRENELITKEARDLIERLLVVRPQHRLGSGERQGCSYAEFKAHPFFKSVDFSQLFAGSPPDLKKEAYQPRILTPELQHSLYKQIQSEHCHLFNPAGSVLMCELVQQRTTSCFRPGLLVLRKGFQLYLLTEHDKLRLHPSVGEQGWLRELGEGRFGLLVEEVQMVVVSTKAAQWVELISQQQQHHHQKQQQQSMQVKQ